MRPGYSELRGFRHNLSAGYAGHEEIPLTDHFGVELRDFFMLQPLGVDDLVLLRSAFDQGVVLVRGQELRDEGHDRFTRALRELHTFPWGGTVEYMSNVIPDNPSIAGTRRLLFHTDGV
jgi:hypothetical protein